MIQENAIFVSYNTSNGSKYTPNSGLEADIAEEAYAVVVDGKRKWFNRVILYNNILSDDKLIKEQIILPIQAGRGVVVIYHESQSEYINKVINSFDNAYIEPGWSSHISLSEETIKALLKLNSLGHKLTSSKVKSISAVKLIGENISIDNPIYRIKEPEMTQMRRRLQYAWDSNHGKRILTGILLLSYNTAEKLASLSIYDIDAYVITLKADEILNDNNGELEIVARHEEALQSYLKNDDKEYGRTIKRLNSITNKEFVEEAGKIIQNFIGVEAKDEIRATDYRYGYTSYSNDNSKVFVIYMTEDIDTQRLLRTLNSAISESAFLIIVSKWFSAEIVKECIGFNSDFFIVDMASLSVINQHKVEDFEISLKRQQRGYLENIIEDQE